MKILVTGATGHLGTKVVDSLLKKVLASEIVVSVRSPEKAIHLKNRGVEVRQGDFDQPEDLATTFTGIDRLLIISTDGDNEIRVRQHKNAVEAAKKAGVKFIAYTSVVNASNNGLFLAEVHRTTEEVIKNTGIPYCFLRNNWYVENEIGSIQAVLAGAPWVTSAGTGKVGWALRQDYADAAAVVLTSKGHNNKVYELSGKSMTQEEFVTILDGVLDRKVTMLQVDDATYGKIMKENGVPDPVLPILVGIQKGIREGSLDIDSNDFEALVGRGATPLKEAIPQIIRELQKSK